MVLSGQVWRYFRGFLSSRVLYGRFHSTGKLGSLLLRTTSHESIAHRPMLLEATGLWARRRRASWLTIRCLEQWRSSILTYALRRLCARIADNAPVVCKGWRRRPGKKPRNSHLQRLGTRQPDSCIAFSRSPCHLCECIVLRSQQSHAYQPVSRWETITLSLIRFPWSS